MSDDITFQDLEKAYLEAGLGAEQPEAILLGCDVCNKCFWLTMDNATLCEHLRELLCGLLERKG